ncbi:MAG TPA: MFS transporter [Stellaceae bacterium]|nr:MFS transporter [Stellaceae bacterium]
MKGLLRHSDFLKLWAAQTSSQFGGQVAVLTVPLTAALILKATPFEMGVLTAAGTAPHVLLSLFAGAWADRRNRRSILISADVGRAMLMLVIPLAFFLHALGIGLMILVASLTGALTVLFDIAHQSYLPSLVGREHLTDGNAKLLATQSAALLIGPGIAGALVGLISAPGALVITSMTFVASAAFLAWIRTRELASLSATVQPMLKQIRAGLCLVIMNPLLRAVAGYQATSNLFMQMVIAILVLYCIRTLSISPWLLGLMFSGSSIGFLLGALSARRISHVAGPGPCIVWGATVMCLGCLAIPFASGAPLHAALIVGAGLALSGFGETIFLANQMSLRQAITPDRLQGRMNATMRFLTWSFRPIGAVLGGVIGDAFGLWAALIIGTGGMLLALPWIYASPLLAAHKMPPLVE